VLLEIVFSLTLFVAAGATVIGGLNWSNRSVGAMRVGAHAADLAVSVLSRIQAGEIELKDDGPNPAEYPHEDWTWQVVTSEVDVLEGMPEMVEVQVIVTNAEKPFTYRLVQRMPPGAAAAAEEEGFPQEEPAE
jgi:hypothetical protein